MTKEDFLDIIDSNNKEIINKYINDPEFVAFVKELRKEFAEEKEKREKDFQEEKNRINNAINALIEQNKNTIPNIEVLSIDTQFDERDVYEDLGGSELERESIKGNVLVCSYNELELKVIGIYQDVEVINFQNEMVFVIDSNSVVNGLGNGDDTSGSDTLNDFLSYLYLDILEPSIKIDSNLFNTGADYFVLIN